MIALVAFVVVAGAIVPAFAALALYQRTPELGRQLGIASMRGGMVRSLVWLGLPTAIVLVLGKREDYALVAALTLAVVHGVRVLEAPLALFRMSRSFARGERAKGIALGARLVERSHGAGWLTMHALSILVRGRAYAEAEALLGRVAAERTARYFRGLIEAATERTDDALGRMKPDELPEAAIVAAQAYAARGEEPGALAAIEQLRGQPHGEELLARLAQSTGPAHVLAQRVLEGVQAPYR